MAGLLNMGGLGGLLGSTPQSNATIAQLFNPTSMRNAQVKKGLLQAGLALMNPDPKAPPSGFGGAIGRAAAGGFQGAEQAKQDFLNDGMMSMQLQGMQREEDQRLAQQQAMDALIPTLPPDVQAFARAYPQQFGEAYIKAQMPKDPNYDIIQDKSTGEIVAVDKNNPAGGPMVVRKGGLSMDAPETRVVKQADGSEVAVQWNPSTQEWVPMKAPLGGNAVNSLPKLTEQQSKDLVYYQRGAAAGQTLDQMEGALTGLGDNIKSGIPMVGNAMVSQEFQSAQQAGREFLASILRKDTGAAVTQQELDLYGKVFLPQYGDSPETLAQKRESRRVALEAIKTGLGAASRALPADQEQDGGGWTTLQNGVRIREKR